MTNTFTRFLNFFLVAAFAVAILMAAAPARAQSGVRPPPPEGDERPGHPPTQGPPPEARRDNPFRRLNLTPEQFAQIRAIRRESQPEGRLLIQRLRAAEAALDRALYADNSDEAAVQQRAHELAEAQAAVTRMRARIEWSIRQVLSPSQLGMLRELRLQAQRQRPRRDAPGPEGPPANAFDEPPPDDAPDRNTNPRLPLPRPRRGPLIRRQP